MGSVFDILRITLEFLKKPNGLAVFFVITVLCFVGYILPLGIMTFMNLDSLKRIELAIRESCMNRVEQLSNGRRLRPTE